MFYLFVKYDGEDRHFFKTSTKFLQEREGSGVKRFITDELGSFSTTQNKIIMHSFSDTKGAIKYEFVPPERTVKQI
jgi:hypothetical protein